MAGYLLYIDWNFDPVFFEIAGVDIRYYGLMWALAILIGGWFFSNFCRRESLKPEVADSIFIYGTIATIVGARVGHCLFYEPGYFLTHPLAIITGIRNGGMASHGAAIGLLIGLWLFSRKNRLPYLWSLDRIMIPVGIGGAIVRLGNLFNSEIVGCETAVPWGFRFMRLYRDVPADMVPVQHPTQIYEALCYLATFGILCWLYYGRDYGRRRPGVMFGVGLVGIFLTRFFIEFIKEEQEAFEQGMLLDMGQLLSLPFIAVAVWMIWRSTRRRPAVQSAAAPQPRVKPKKNKSRRW
ncbi:MAG: prolipoprotein diacylglyceryl transferase [Alistipes sp.]|nr:prolipoprotein diacylglyceryl transferase [Alistipes sp.]